MQKRIYRYFIALHYTNANNNEPNTGCKHQQNIYTICWMTVRCAVISTKCFFFVIVQMIILLPVNLKALPL